jgi:carbon monoxide dehydrogenase subunit G
VLIENGFEVAAPVERVWAYLLDVEKVAPCMPGAELTETVDDTTWKGKVTVKLGPVGLSFAGTVVMAERDDAAHRVVLNAKGMEQRGRGAATAVVTAFAEPTGPDTTKVSFSQDLTVSGAVAQYSRGMMQDVSSKLTRRFADCIQANIQAEQAADPGEATPQAVAKPVAGIRLGIWALFRAIGRFFRRLFGGGRDEEPGGDA